PASVARRRGPPPTPRGRETPRSAPPALVPPRGTARTTAPRNRPAGGRRSSPASRRMSARSALFHPPASHFLPLVRMRRGRSGIRAGRYLVGWGVRRAGAASLFRDHHVCRFDDGVVHVALDDLQSTVIDAGLTP